MNADNDEAIFGGVLFLKSLQIWQNVDAVDAAICEKIQHRNFSMEMLFQGQGLGDVEPFET